MVAQAISTIGIEGRGGVIGGSRDLKGVSGGAFQGHGGLKGGIDPDDLGGLTFDFGGAGGGLGCRDGGGLFGAIGPATGQVERIPAKAEAAEDQDDRSEGHEAQREPAERRKCAKDRWGHG